MTDDHASHAAAQPASAHADDGMVGPHGSNADHGADHGHDAHAHGEAPAEKVDLPAWGAGALGVVLGIAVVIALVLATGGLH